MVTTAAAVDWVTVGTEVEALQLEYSWIKEFDPRFNVRYRDDKSYPFLAVTLDEEYPAAAGDARRQAQGRALLRAVLARLGHPRDARPAAAGLPGAHLLRRACSSGPARSAGRACSATSASARRRASAGSAPRSTGRSSTTSATSWPAAPTRWSSRLEREMHAGLRAARVRAGGPAARRHRRAAPGDGEADRRARRRHRRRRGRLRRGPAGGRGAGLPRPRRPGPRPARLGGGEGRGPDHRRPGAPLLHPGVRRRAGRGRRARASCWCPRCPPDADALADWLSRAPRQPGQRCGCRSAATRRR